MTGVGGCLLKPSVSLPACEWYVSVSVQAGLGRSKERQAVSALQARWGSLVEEMGQQ